MHTNFDQLKQIFLDAVEQHPPDQWDAYLDEACGQDAELRRQAAMLLKAHVESAGRAEPTAGDDAKTTAYGNLSEQPGMVIGPYKLLEQIGEGGFGVVFMAEQTAPIRRKVALKILKPGMDTRQVVARFEAERQALAIMDHPNIAKVLDAGSTPTGRPYFVMELVKGVPITEFCDQNQLTPRQRLELFIAVCQAVQHAHQKGVIHRDLKPSNVLVSVHDTTPVPKVIDFGIAKALGQELTDKTLFTGFAQMVGTPLYMSPEQAGHSSLDIDTRSDVYSLGVLLYELLTGATPFDKNRFKKAAYDEIRRIIREEEPPKPSTRLSGSDSLPSVSAQRQTEPTKLTKLVRGDLDWIVMKALEKDRNRRYETANGFAMDVQRYLADEPVQACPPTVSYRLRKFARRNTAALTAGMLIAAALVVAVATLAVSNVWITRERDEKVTALEQKEQALEVADQQRKLAHENLIKAREAVDQMLTRVAEERLAHVPQMEPVRRALLEDALKFYEGFLQQDAKDPAMRLATAQAWYRVGLIHSYLGKYADAHPASTKASAMLEALLAETPHDRACRFALGENCRALGCLLVLLERHHEAETALSRGSELFGSLAVEFPSETFLDQQADCQRHLASLLQQSGRYETAEQAYRQVLVIRQKRVAAAPSELHRYWLADTYRALGELLHQGNRRIDAEEAYREAVAILEPLVVAASTNPDYCLCLACSYARLAELKHQLKQSSKAEELFGKAIGLCTRLSDEFPIAPGYREHLFVSLVGLGDVLADTNRPQESEERYRQAIRGTEKLIVDVPGRAAYRRLAVNQRTKLAILLARTGRNDAADEEYRRALAISDGLIGKLPNVPKDKIQRANTLRWRGKMLATSKQTKEAERAYREVVDLLKSVIGGDSSEKTSATDPRLWNDLAAGHSGLGDALRNNHRLQEANESYRQAVAGYGKALEQHPDDASSWNNRGVTYSRLGQFHEAAADFSKAITLKPDEILFWKNRASTYFGLGKWDEAATDYSKLIELAPDPKQQAGFYFNRAVANTKLSRFQQARDDYKKSLDIAPNSAVVYNNLAWLLSTCPDPQLRDPSKAVTLAKKAVELAPEDGNNWNTLGAAQYRVADWKAAIEALERSMELRKGGDSFDWFFLAMAHWQLGEKEQARRWYDQAVQWMEKNQPQNEELLRFRAEADALLTAPDPRKDAVRDTKPQQPSR